MDVAEEAKTFDVQCIWGRIFVSLEKIFVFKYLQTIYISFSFYVKCIWESVRRTFLKAFFLGAHTIQAVPKYIWMQHWKNLENLELRMKILNSMWVN